jgi:hypothetical protein
VPGTRRRCLSAPAPPVDLLRLPTVVVHGDGDGAVAPMLASSMPPPWPPLLPAVAAPASSSARGGSTSHHSRVGPAAASARRRLARMARHRLRPPPRRSAADSCRDAASCRAGTVVLSHVLSPARAAPAPDCRRLKPRCRPRAGPPPPHAETPPRARPASSARQRRRPLASVAAHLRRGRYRRARQRGEETQGEDWGREAEGIGHGGCGLTRGGGVRDAVGIGHGG